MNPPTLPCPSCRKDVIRKDGVSVYACPWCRQELRDTGDALQLVDDPPDHRRKVSDNIGGNKNIFRNL